MFRFILLKTFLAFSFLLPGFGFAQTDSSISFIAYWKKGDVKRFRITKSETKVNQGIRAKDKQSKFDVVCRVLDSTAQGYRLSWECDNETLRSMPVPKGYEDIVSKYATLKVEYLTDDVGSYKEILNWEEVAKMMGEMFDLLVNADTARSKELGKAIAPLRNAFMTKEGIEALVLQDIQLLHYPMGIQISRYDTIPYEQSLPNLLGGAPMKGVGSLYVRSWNPNTGICDFINMMKVDSADAKEYVTQMVTSVINNMDHKTEADRQKALKELNAQFSLMNFDIRDKYDFQYEVDPGWPIRIEGGRKTILTVASGTENSSEKRILIEAVK